MKNVPCLLNYGSSVILRAELFSDLKLDKILSEQALSVISRPCGRDEMIGRNELFYMLDTDENLLQVERLLSVLSAADKALYLLKNANTVLDGYYGYVNALELYADSCEMLASMTDLGRLFFEISAYYSFDEKKLIASKARKSVQNIKALLEKMRVGLLTFSDKAFLTPNYNAVSEADEISACAENLGFAVPKKKKQNIKVNHSLSDAMCRLYPDEVAAIENEIADFSNVDMHEPSRYIPEIKFFLEIHELIQKARDAGIPCFTAKIADHPVYTAKELYDVSLLAKKCERIVPNDADFTENEKFCFLLGANGGGKTTYLRAVGVNLVLFLSGCPIFAKYAEIYPFDMVFSHFPKDERFDRVGRLDEELSRTEDLLNLVQGKTAFVLFNETFSGADDTRGFELLTDVAEKIRNNEFFGVYVTHFHEVMSLDYPVLSAYVDTADENKRTFRIIRSKGKASSYTLDILKKYRLDKESLSTRRGEYGN